MRKLCMVSGLSGLAAVAVSLSSAAVATASPDVVGDTYSDASAEIAAGGGSVVVASRTGSQLAQDDCIVTNAWDASFLRDGSAADGEVMVALNCAGGYATATNPGSSVLSPAGRDALAEADAAEETPAGEG